MILLGSIRLRVLVLVSAGFLSSGAAYGQEGSVTCRFPSLPRSDAAWDSLGKVPDSPFVLDSILWSAVRFQAHPAPVVRTLQTTSDRYGSATVSKSLLTIVLHGSPYFINAQDRGRAAIAYGSLHRMYPAAAPAAPMSSLLADRYFPEEVKIGLAIATRYFRGDLTELREALQFELCEALRHIRPFVADESDLTGLAAPHWYSVAVDLVEELTRALAVRPGGLDYIVEQMRQESNRALGRQVLQWAEEADTTPYWFEESEGQVKRR